MLGTTANGRSLSAGTFAWSVVARVGGGMGAVCRRLVAALRIQSAGAEHRRVESRKLDLFQDMGRVVYQMYLEDRVKTKRLAGLCKSVAQLDAQSREAENRSEALRRDS